MSDTKTNILIVGCGAVASALSKKFSQYSSVGDIYVTDSKNSLNEYYKNIDIREDDITGLLKFALENDISITIPISELALQSEITSFFQSNGQNIFAPAENASKNIINKVRCRKFLYKNKAQSSKFAIHSKFSQASEYVKNANFPLVISTAEPSDTLLSSMLCTTLAQALDFIEKMFLTGEQDILIQEYPYGTNFTAYFITDGYSALPLCSAHNFKFENADMSGKYTKGVGCYAPEYKVNSIVMERIQNILGNILHSFEKNESPYVGIIGLECVLTENDNFYVQDLKPFLQPHDARAILNLCEDNLIDVIMACVNGSFSDDYECIQMNDSSSASVVVSVTEQNLIEISEVFDIDMNNVKFDKDKIYSNGENTFVITKCAVTLSRAKDKLKQEIDEIKILNAKYRKDICDRIQQ